MYEAEERHWWFRGRRAVIRAMLDRAEGGSAAGGVLDVGCGTGRNLELYASFGEAEGVDPSPEAVRFCRMRGLDRVQVGGAESFPFDDRRFGLVAATDTLQPIRDDS